MSADATVPLLDARRLTRRFQGLVSVDEVSFTLARNEVLGLVGPNGAGKTTLINLISGTLAPDEGEVRFEGARVDGLPPYRRAHLGIGRTFQVMKPFPGLSALENVTVGALFGRGGEHAAREGARVARANGSPSPASSPHRSARRRSRRARPKAARARQGACHAAQAPAARRGDGRP